MSARKRNWLDKKNATYIIIGVWVIYLSSLIDITIPGTDIPITGQSLAVLTVSYLLKENLGVIAVFLYIVLGAIGLPVFADGASGLEVIRGKSGGYIYGFLFAAWLITQLRTIRNKINVPTIIFSMFLGTMAIVGIGYMHLSQSIGYSDAYFYGVKPFIVGAIIKIFLGSMIVILFQRLFPNAKWQI